MPFYHHTWTGVIVPLNFIFLAWQMIPYCVCDAFITSTYIIHTFLLLLKKCEENGNLRCLHRKNPEVQ